MPEELLRRYRPAGPDPDLRARICAAAPARRAWPWAAAAAALLAVTVVLRSQAGEQSAHIVPPPVDTRRAAVDQLTMMLGGTEDARVLAETIALHEQMRAERIANATAPRQENP